MLLVLALILYLRNRMIGSPVTVSGILIVRLLLLLALAARSPLRWRLDEPPESGQLTQGCESRELNADRAFFASSAANGDITEVESLNIFESGLSIQVDVPSVLIREGGKLPPPTSSVLSPESHKSSLGLNDADAKIMELEGRLLSRSSLLWMTCLLVGAHFARSCSDCIKSELAQRRSR